MLSQIDLIRLIQPELSTAKLKNSYLITHNFLNMISKYLVFQF